MTKQARIVRSVDPRAVAPKYPRAACDAREPGDLSERTVARNRGSPFEWRARGTRAASDSAAAVAVVASDAPAGAKRRWQCSCNVRCASASAQCRSSSSETLAGRYAEKPRLDRFSPLRCSSPHNAPNSIETVLHTKITNGPEVALRRSSRSCTREGDLEEKPLYVKKLTSFPLATSPRAVESSKRGSQTALFSVSVSSNRRISSADRKPVPS